MRINLKAKELGFPQEWIPWFRAYSAYLRSLRLAPLEKDIAVINYEEIAQRQTAHKPVFASYESRRDELEEELNDEWAELKTNWRQRAIDLDEEIKEEQNRFREKIQGMRAELDAEIKDERAAFRSKRDGQRADLKRQRAELDAEWKLHIKPDITGGIGQLAQVKRMEIRRMAADIREETERETLALKNRLFMVRNEAGLPHYGPGRAVPKEFWPPGFEWKWPEDALHQNWNTNYEDVSPQAVDAPWNANEQTLAPAALPAPKPPAANARPVVNTVVRTSITNVPIPTSIQADYSLQRVFMLEGLGMEWLNETAAKHGITIEELKAIKGHYKRGGASAAVKAGNPGALSPAALRALDGAALPPKSKGGRPKGSKNKPKEPPTDE